MTASYKHTLHCEEMVMKNRTTPLEKVNTIVHLKYPACGYLSV